MNFELVWNGEAQDLLVTTSGEARPGAFEEMVQGVLADPRFRPRMRILIDHRGTMLWMLSDEEVEQRAARVRLLAETIGPQRVAFVAGSTLDFGRLEKFARLLEGQVPFELHASQSVEEAREWLGSVDLPLTTSSSAD